MLVAQTATPADRLMTEIKTHSRAMADLESLSDDIGPRLTGSENLAKAQNWAAGKMREYGAANVHFESYSFPSRWERGTDDFAKLLTQSGRQMTVHAMPWNPPTNGLVEADVALLQGDVDTLMKGLGDLDGKILVFGRLRGSESKVKGLMKEVGKRAVATLVSMEHMDGKFTMYGSPGDDYFNDYFGGWPRIPFGFLTVEDRSMLERLVNRKQTVRMQLRLGGSITKQPVEERNVVGEIRGSEKPDEVVIVGGHLDSWDLGTGTTDNGTGSVATIETLRAMKALGLKPKRTIRFVLFSGEEQGSYGAKAYVKAHQGELKNIQAVLIHDLGGGKPHGFTAQGYKQWVPALKEAIAPLKKLKADAVLVDQHWDSDQDPFINAGVPGFFLDQDIKEYFASTHHSQVDMLDHVKAADYIPSVQAIAAATWGFANLPQRVPHVKPGKLVGP